MMHRSPPRLAITLVLALAACNATADARQAGQARYHGRSLEEWWQLRRDPDDAVSIEARAAMSKMGATAVPFLAEKAASHDLGDMIGGSGALESMCPSAIPAMEAARSRYPSPALDAAIRRIQRDTADAFRAHFCTAGGDSARVRGQQ
ncbi:hypothetical protein tb265_05920 [Gemmatimonadetes bacterium T265]|nr:hypothetical protein tb265_05920 [Gemmatimonadetes bacterium T265]